MSGKKQKTLKALRLLIGYSQNGFANHIGYKGITLQFYEQGRFKTISEDFADAVVFHTGINKKWLLENNPKKPAVDQFGRPYTLKTFETVAASSKTQGTLHGINLTTVANIRFCALTRHLADVLLAAMQKDEFAIYAFKIAQKLDELKSEIGHPGFGDAPFGMLASPQRANLKFVEAEWAKEIAHIKTAKGKSK